MATASSDYPQIRTAERRGLERSRPTVQHGHRVQLVQSDYVYEFRQEYVAAVCDNFACCKMMTNRRHSAEMTGTWTLFPNDVFTANLTSDHKTPLTKALRHLLAILHKLHMHRNVHLLFLDDLDADFDCPRDSATVQECVFFELYLNERDVVIGAAFTDSHLDIVAVDDDDNLSEAMLDDSIHLPYRPTAHPARDAPVRRRRHRQCADTDTAHRAQLSESQTFSRRCHDTFISLLGFSEFQLVIFDFVGSDCTHREYLALQGMNRDMLAWSTASFEFVPNSTGKFQQRKYVDVEMQPYIIEYELSDIGADNDIGVLFEPLLLMSGYIGHGIEFDNIDKDNDIVTNSPFSIQDGPEPSVEMENFLIDLMRYIGVETTLDDAARITARYQPQLLLLSRHIGEVDVAVIDADYDTCVCLGVPVLNGAHL